MQSSDQVSALVNQINALTNAVAAIEDRFKPPPPPSKAEVHHQELVVALSSLSQRLSNPFVFTVAYNQVQGISGTQNTPIA